MSTITIKNDVAPRIMVEGDVWPVLHDAMYSSLHPNNNRSAMWLKARFNHKANPYNVIVYFGYKVRNDTTVTASFHAAIPCTFESIDVSIEEIGKLLHESPELDAADKENFDKLCQSFRTTYPMTM